LSLSNDSKSQPTPRFAVIGAGTMGTAMALRLLGAGMEVDVWSRHATSTAPPIDAVATAHDEATDAVRKAGVVITMLPTADITSDVVMGGHLLDAMAPESIWVQMATTGAVATEQLAAETPEVATRRHLRRRASLGQPGSG
jgi:3-hydroxyisobutyrate dehydrogenase-like beta-hydroxyacid dehydrogenase